MKRLFYLMFWFFFGVALVAVPMFTFASEFPVYVPGVSAVGENLIYTSRAGISSVVYPSMATTAPLNVPLPPVAGVPAGNQLMTIPATISPNVARVAQSVVLLARIAGPVGLGVNLLSILCSETSLCSSASSPSTLVKNSLGGYCNTSGSVNPQYACGQATCDARTAEINYPHATYVPKSFGDTGNIVRIAECKNDAYWQGVQPGQVVGTVYKRLDGSTVSAPPVEGDFNDAISKLTAATSRMADIVSGLQGQGQPVPIDKPVLSPSSVSSPADTVVNRDAQGNITNTTTTTTTTNSSPVTNNKTENTTNITQTTITTVTNSSGGVTSTTTKAAEPPKPDDPDIQFDKVDDVPLEKQELPLSMPAPSSWGEGSCPGDPSVSVMGHPITVPVHVVCAYMEGVRGAVIAVFALISAYIVIGVKFEG